ncbi:DUF6390 family protein [Mycolicibacterium holsaticum]|uniref:Uncharacterized protein n=1 Tax=Mycolicibacterium holsaticum TaxID=152142 RepID=A0A1E3RLG9_9MYCO|nr:DUF6390 family protein [Mycolicibacterium holsaticum]ODQ90272.1 hypothetical protein BHQ17_17345 [Mycolicibacterium holsaticum]
MTQLTMGQTLFGRYAYPPNELGYCGPTDGGGASGVGSHAAEFDGAWPYLAAIADAVGGAALDEDVVNSYWVGGPALRKVDPAALLTRLRTAFSGQVTGMLDALPATADVLAHHSFHVLVVYPWVRFLDRDAATAVRVMQACRIRCGTVETIDGERAVISSRPLRFEDGRLVLGDRQTETVYWKKGDVSLAPAPTPGTVVSAHWDWVCDTLTDTESAALEAATATTLELVNSCVHQGVQI